MTEDAPSTGSGESRDIPPPSVAPADAAGDRPTTEGPAPAPPPPPPAQTAVVGAPPPPPGATTAVVEPPPPAPPASAPQPRRPGMGLLPIALGVGLLASAVVQSTVRSRSDGDLDWSNYSVGLGATAALLLFALTAAVLGTGRSREELVTWPGAIGILGVGAMLGVGLEDVDSSEDWLAYLVGGVVVVLSVVGYAVIRRGAFVVTAILGLGLAYAQFADDVISDIGDDDDWPIIAAATIAVFVLVVTAVGWLLRSRALSGVVAGVIGVVGINIVLLTLVFVQVFAGFFGGMGGMGMDDDSAAADDELLTSIENSRSALPDYDTDVYVVLGIAAVLTLLWALAAALNGNPGFTVLAIAMPASVVPTATFALMVEHPTRWGVGFAAAGAVLLAAVGLKQMLGRRKQT